MTQPPAPPPPNDGPSTGASYVAQLPVQALGLTNIPAVPYWADAYGDPDQTHIGLALERLLLRGPQGATAYGGLNTQYTIGGQTHYGYEFLFGGPLPGSADPPPALGPSPTVLSLDAAAQYTLAWTTWESVYQCSEQYRTLFADTLTDPVTANRLFWPTIASFGIPYNLLVLEKYDATRFPELGAGLDTTGTYVIDMGIIASLGTWTPPGQAVRSAPGTVTLLKQDAKTKALTPVRIQILTRNSTQTYDNGDPAWLYALQAAKASITVWGIWLGHVYHWHIVTAATQMTMFNTLPAGHPLWPLLQPQSQSLIDFDFALLAILFGRISPPTPVDSGLSLLRLLDTFASGRGFFDDDPRVELKKQGITKEDFSLDADWDQWPVAGYLLRIWDAAEAFVQAVVDELYSKDSDVKGDPGLQAWLTATRAPAIGNVDLPPIETVELLTQFLTSLLYRVTVHGAGSLTTTVSPALAFVSNFPPCLQRTDIPAPTDKLTAQQLLSYLPQTGTIGGMATFYFTFAYSLPNSPLIPAGGVQADPYWPPGNPLNNALFAFRTAIANFVGVYNTGWNGVLAKLLGVKPGPLPMYSQGQAAQWPRSIEI